MTSRSLFMSFTFTLHSSLPFSSASFFPTINFESRNWFAFYFLIFFSASLMLSSSSFIFCATLPFAVIVALTGFAGGGPFAFARVREMVLAFSA